MDQEGETLLQSHIGTKRSRELEVPLLSERREKRQKMPRVDEKRNKEKKMTKKKKEQRKLMKRLLDELMTEIKPIAIGSIAMVFSVLANQGKHMCTVVSVNNANNEVFS